MTLHSECSKKHTGAMIRSPPSYQALIYFRIFNSIEAKNNILEGEAKAALKKLSVPFGNIFLPPGNEQLTSILNLICIFCIPFVFEVHVVYLYNSPFWEQF